MNNIYVASFTYCEGVQRELSAKGVVSKVITPLNYIKPISLPSNYSFSLSFSLIFTYPIKNEPRVTIKFSSPSDEVLYKTNNISIAPQIPQCKPNNPLCIQFVLDIRNVVLNAEGIYYTQIIVDDVVIGDFKIAVVKK